MKKSILIALYDMEIGGIERSLINMLESFNYDEYDVDLLIYEQKGDLLKFIPNEVNILPQINAYTVFRKPIKQCISEGHIATSFMRVISKYLSGIKAKQRKLKEGSAYIQMQLALKYSMYFLPPVKKHYDVAISYAWPHDIVAKKVKAHKKIAWIHTDYSKLEVDQQIDFNIWNQFEHIGSISDDVTRTFLTSYPLLKKKIFQMQNINSPKFIRKMAKEAVTFDFASHETFKLVSVGRLSYAKGFDIAIESLKKLHDKGFTSINWYVVGYGPEETRLKDQIKKHNLEEHFILLGKQQNPYPFIKNADLYVQPSRYEGKAVTVTEAKILGKPILISNYSTSKSQINHKRDGYITGLSVEGIAEGIRVLAKDKALREHLAQNCQLADYNNKREIENLYSVIKEKQDIIKKQTMSF